MSVGARGAGGLQRVAEWRTRCARGRRWRSAGGGGSEYVKSEEDGLDDKDLLLLGEWLGEYTIFKMACPPLQPTPAHPQPSTSSSIFRLSSSKCQRKSLKERRWSEEEDKEEEDEPARKHMC